MPGQHSPSPSFPAATRAPAYQDGRLAHQFAAIKSAFNSGCIVSGFNPQHITNNFQRRARAAASRRRTVDDNRRRQTARARRAGLDGTRKCLTFFRNHAGQPLIKGVASHRQTPHGSEFQTSGSDQTPEADANCSIFCDLGE